MSNAGDLAIGPGDTDIVTGLRGRPLSIIAPAVGDVLTFNGAQWVFGFPSGQFRLLAFDVTDDDGIVAAHSVVTHILTAAGVLATDHVVGVESPGVALGSGIVVTGNVFSAGNVQLSYNNILAVGSTNGSVTYRVFVAR